jgi:putative component of toxin-antitoxin plasmid stabilization module
MTAKRKIERRLRTQATFDATIDLAQADAAKVRVMAYFRELVAGGYADWHTLRNGNIRLRMHTGEVYLLEKTTITRLA